MIGGSTHDVSTRLAPAPEKSQAEIDAEVEQIRAKYGKLRSTDPRVRLRAKEIREAKQPTPPLVKADYLVRQWLSGEQRARIDSELETGVATVVGLLVRDLADPSLPDPKAQEYKTVLEQKAERSVVRYNFGQYGGGLSSEPTNFQPAPSNATRYSDKLGKVTLPRK